MGCSNYLIIQLWIKSTLCDAIFLQGPALLFYDFSTFSLATNNHLFCPDNSLYTTTDRVGERYSCGCCSRVFLKHRSNQKRDVNFREVMGTSGWVTKTVTLCQKRLILILWIIMELIFFITQSQDLIFGECWWLQERCASSTALWLVLRMSKESCIVLNELP